MALWWIFVPDNNFNAGPWTGPLTALLVLLLGSAWAEPAATWTVGVPLARAATPDGSLDLPAGVALLLLTDRPDLVRIEGEAPTRGVPGGLLVPASGTSRSLRVIAPPDVAVRVHRSDAPGTDAAWDAWERAAARTLRDGAPAPEPPWGGARLAASVTLRARAVGDPEVALLGLAHDAEALRPLGGAAHVSVAERPILPGEPMTVHGPGAAVVRASAPPGALTRFEVTVAIDGSQQVRAPIASAGTAPVAVRVWIPPGAHTLTTMAPGREDVAFTVEASRLRGRLLPLARRAGTAAVAEAERLWLMGDVAAARQEFAGFVDAPGPTGELARARLLASTTDPAEALRLALLDGASPEGREVLADAILGAARLLPDAVVLEAARTAADPDLDALAAWLDATSGVRPRGVAALEMAAPDVPVGPTSAARALRVSGLDTRWTRLAPSVAAGPLVERATPEGPGVPRLELGPGESTEVTLPARAAGRFPVLRLAVAGPARFRVDGTAYFASQGAIDLALTARAHTLAVDEGHVRVLDPELASGSATRIYTWDAAPLPATWAIPDPGVAVDVAVTVGGPGGFAPPEGAAAKRPVDAIPGDWLAVFDDGSTQVFTPDRSPVLLRAGPCAENVTLYGPPGATAGVAVRAVFPPTPAPPLSPPADEDAAIRAIEALTQAVDRGDPRARAERARLLGQLGQLGLARRDVNALLASGDVDTARALATAVVPEVPSAPAPGPVSVAAALAAAGWSAPFPEDPSTLERLAAELHQPWLYTAASDGWLSAGDPARALAAARAAGDAGADAAAAVEARLRWTPVAFADRSAGLVEAPLVPSEGEGSLWQRVRDALVAVPWGAGEGIVVRAPTSDLVSFTGTKVEADLFCRDEGAGGRPCRVTVRLDGARRTLDVPDAGTLPLAWSVGSGSHTLEVVPLEDERAVAVRARVDGALLPPGGTATALRAAPGHPITLTVATPSVLRIATVRGRATVHVGGVIAEGGLVPLPGPGSAQVEIRGDADVLLAVGTLARAGAPAPPPLVPPPAARVPMEAIAPILARLSTPPSPERTIPADTGTWAFSLSALHTRVKAPVEPWEAIEAETAWMRAGPSGWADLVGWARGPAWAGGFEGELGRAWPGWLAAAELRGSAGKGVVNAAGGAAVTGRVRRTFVLDPVQTLWTEARARAGWWSADPIAPVDPRAWSWWNAHHPAFLALSGGWGAAPLRDLRLSASVGATSNTGPSVDHVSATLGADVLVGSALVLSPTASLRWRFADADRTEAGAWTDLRLRADAVRWYGPGYRAQVWGEVGLVQAAPTGRIGITVLTTAGRGLHDLPPGAEPFREARGHSPLQRTVFEAEPG